MKREFKKIHPTLPIFQIMFGKKVIIYTPGHLILLNHDESHLLSDIWKHESCLEISKELNEKSSWLEKQARKAIEKWNELINKSFLPECLTIYLSNECNLACPYCYTFKSKSNIRTTKSRFIIDENIVQAAAKVVARHCSEKKKFFTLVLSGGGEPTIHWDLLQQITNMSKRTASEFGIRWWGYIATNGIIDESKVRWLAENFHLIGLSCDGPSSINNKQRPLLNNIPSSSFIENTAHAIIHAGGKFNIRTTITPKTYKRQEEIVKYLIEILGAQKIRFEPVFRYRNSGFKRIHAESFVYHFLNAQRLANRYGSDLSLAGIRLNEIHGPYCDVLRDNLRLTRDGTAVNCFCITYGLSPYNKKFVIGNINHLKEDYNLEQQIINASKLSATRFPEECQECINSYHCSRGCPDWCWEYLENSEQENSLLSDSASFRCLVYQNLATAWIKQAARQIITGENQREKILISSHRKNLSKLETYLNAMPPNININKIISQFEAIQGKYKIKSRQMPSPIWAERGFELNSRCTWNELQKILVTRETKPISIYIHVPFCDRRCGFCDCFSYPNLQDKVEKEKLYINMLSRDIKAWSKLEGIFKRPVTTIHFGGGTPNYLSQKFFTEIINKISDYFYVTDSTEWALESTGSMISAEHLSYLKTLGFSRLHIGVQTMDNKLRKIIGRREEAAEIEQKIGMAINKDFITTVDIIYGIPGQTFLSLFKTLERLNHLKVHGFSIYHLNISIKNYKFIKNIKNFKKDIIYDYLLFQIADNYLTDNGYFKNHFTHYAKPQDRNLYYTHAKRGEDLLALGPTSDGVFDHFHFRYPNIKEYLYSKSSLHPIFKGGIWENDIEKRLKPIEIPLLCGGIEKKLIRDLDVEELLLKWLDRKLLQYSPPKGEFLLTANGSWFIADLFMELKNLIR